MKNDYHGGDFYWAMPLSPVFGLQHVPVVEAQQYSPSQREKRRLRQARAFGAGACRLSEDNAASSGPYRRIEVHAFAQSAEHRDPIGLDAKIALFPSQEFRLTGTIVKSAAGRIGSTTTSMVLDR